MQSARLWVFVFVAMIGVCGCGRSAPIPRDAAGSDLQVETSLVASGSGTMTTTATSTGTATDVCSNPECFSVVMNCLGQGACQEQTTEMCGEIPSTPCPPNVRPTYRIRTTCFANGVKVKVETNLSTPASVYVDVTARKGGAVCYKMSGVEGPTGSASTSYQVDDGAGARIANYNIDAATGRWSISCREGNVELPASCHPGFLIANRGSICLAGECSWE